MADEQVTGAATRAALTDQERRVALAVGRGTTNKATARQFGVSIKTVEYHLSNIYRKLDLQGRAELAHLVGSGAATLTDPDGAPSPTVTKNPYHGLRAFEEADAVDFFGRTRLVERILDVMSAAGGRFLTVVGPSGCGKSSVVRAGLLPALRRGALAGSDRWRLVAMVPGADPVGRWRLALDGDRGPADDVLALIDQFEELYTLAEPRARDEFVDVVQAALGSNRLRVVAALRGDFLDRPLGDPRLAPLLEAATVLVPPLAPEELDAAIVGPAQRAGVELAAGLPEVITADVRDQPGMLPLLQYALTETFERSPDGVLSLDAYHQIGGVRGAVSRRAEELLREGDDDERAATQRLFTRLVEPGEGTEDTARRVRIAELPDEPEVASVLGRYGAVRLLTFDRDPRTGAPTVELAHEALIREWPRLRAWLDSDREGRRLQQDLTDRATGWADGGEDEGELYRGGRLLLAEQWAADHQPQISTTERRFLDSSVAQRRSEEDRRHRGERRTKRALLLVAVVAVLALVAGAVAWRQQRLASSAAHTADRERDAARAAESTAETGRLATLAPTLAKTDPAVALVLSAEAAKRRADPETWGALEQTLVAIDASVGFLVTDDPVRAVFFDGPDRIVTVSSAAVTVWDARSHQRRSATALAAPVPSSEVFGFRQPIAFSAGTLAWVADDGRAHVLSLRTAEQGVADVEQVDAVAVDAGGRRVALLDRDGDVAVYTVPSMQRVWSVAGTGPRSIKAMEDELGFHPGPELASYPVQGEVAFSPDDATVVAFRGWLATTRDATSGALRASATFPMYVTSLGFESVAPHRLLALGYHAIAAAEVPSLANVDAAGLDSQLPLLEISLRGLRDGRVAVVTQQGHVTFLAAGTPATPAPPPAPLLAAPTTSSELSSLDAHVSAARSTALSPDGATLAVGGDSGAALIRVDGGGLIHRAVPRVADHAYYIGGRDGAWIGTSPLNVSGPRSTPNVWNCAEGPCVREQFDLDPTREIVSDAERDVLAIYSRSAQGTGDWQFFDHATRQPRSPHISPELSVSGWAATAPDASWVAIVNTGASMQIFELPTGRLMSRTQLDTSWVNVGATSLPRGNEVLLYNTDTGGAAVIDVKTGARRPAPLPKGDVVAATFSRSGKYLATAGVNGKVAMRDAKTWEALQQLTTAEAISPFMALAFSDDDRFLLTAHPTGGRLWDVASGQPIGQLIPTLATTAPSALPGEHPHLLTASQQWVQIWDLDVDHWTELACLAAGRNLTRDEWKLVGPRDEEYHATCPQWPAAT